MALVSQETGIFSGYQLSDLRSISLGMLRASDTTRYSPTAGASDYDWIDRALNRGQETFVRKTKCLETYGVLELKANYRTYRMPTNFIDLKNAYFYDDSLPDGYRELTIKSKEEMDEEISDYRTDTGDPTHIYLDRIYGNQWMVGLYPIPDTDGDTITFDSEYGSVVQWVCPNYTFSQEYGVSIRMTNTDEYFLNSDTGIVAKVNNLNKNVWIDYYRLPLKLEYSIQYPEIPKEYQESLCSYAGYKLLQHNPEDSAEFKRAMILKTEFMEEISDYISVRKPPVSGHSVRARVAAHTWMDDMDWHTKLP